MSGWSYYSVETFHLKYDRMGPVMEQHFHTKEEAINEYNYIVKLGLDSGDGVDVRVMKITLCDDLVKKTCIAHMIDEGKYFGSEEE